MLCMMTLSRPHLPAAQGPSQRTLVGVEFAHVRLAVSFDSADDARAALGALLYLCPVTFRVLDPK